MGKAMGQTIQGVDDEGAASGEDLDWLCKDCKVPAGTTL
jgi:hypothetical protein